MHENKDVSFFSFTFVLLLSPNSEVLVSPVFNSHNLFSYLADSSFHVKCGSSQSVTVGDTIFDGDNAIDGGAAFFVSHQGNWALSSTGTIMDNNDDSDVYTVSTNSMLSMPNPALYQTARISPLSLKYYGLCLWSGPYTVKLYFSEIVITDDKNYTSLAKRIFDVYIQVRKFCLSISLARCFKT